MNEVRWLNRRSFLVSENAVCPRSKKIRRPEYAAHKTAVRYMGREGDPTAAPAGTVLPRTSRTVSGASVIYGKPCGLPSRQATSLG